MWKTINGFENYEINQFGQIKNKLSGMLKRHTTAKNGYPTVTLYKNNKGKRFYIHRLIAIYFIPNPNNLPTVNHKDGNKLNNEVNNLEWVSYSLNNKHAYEKGLKIVTKKMLDHAKTLNNSMLQNNPYGANRKPIIATINGVEKEFPNVEIAAKELNFHRCSIDRVLKGARKSARGINFKYKEQTK